MDSDAISRTILAAQGGDPQAASKLLPLLYDDLRGLGRALLRRNRPGQTLQATALVHEAYARLARKVGNEWQGRAHFFGAASRAMRDIVVEDARRKAAIKRGAGRRRVEIDPQDLAAATNCDDVLALNEALERLESADAQKAQIVLLRFFSGLSMQEIADQLGLSKTKVEREWRYARAWLSKELEEGE